MFLFLSCAHCVEARTAEREDLDWVQVTAVQNTDDKTLRVRGCPVSSNSVFSKPKFTIRGNEAWLKNGLRVIRKGVGFEFDINVPNNVDKLVFGNERKVIWPYDDGATARGKDRIKAIDIAKAAFKTNFPTDSLDNYHCSIGNVISNAKRIPVIFFEKDSRLGLHTIYAYIIRAEDFQIDKIYRSQCSLTEWKPGEIPSTSEEIHPPQ